VYTLLGHIGAVLQCVLNADWWSFALACSMLRPNLGSTLQLGPRFCRSTPLQYKLVPHIHIQFNKRCISC